jgi:hypothetical protein
MSNEKPRPIGKMPGFYFELIGARLAGCRPWSTDSMGDQTALILHYFGGSLELNVPAAQAASKGFQNFVGKFVDVEGTISRSVHPKFGERIDWLEPEMVPHVQARV